MNKQKIHFIGIGGIGTSALARWFLAQGYEVSGSDVAISEIISDLKSQGVKIFVGHRSENLSKMANLAIFSAAVPLSNPEIKRAKELGISVKSYAEALGDLTKQYKTIAVAGAHGKSTTTALLSLVLIKSGFDPTVIIGTKLKEFNSDGRFRVSQTQGASERFSGANFRNGKSNWLVMEADEYHKSFLNYSPFAAIITNIDREHLDYYKNLAEIKNVFLKFVKNIKPGGFLIVNKNDKNLFSLKNKIEKIAKKNNLKVIWYGIENSRHSHVFIDLHRVLKIPGEHNISNALGVYHLAKALKIKDKDIFSAFGSYHGAWRRMEFRGYLNLKPKTQNLKPAIYDDYAHHPTEIKATLSGFRQKYPKSKIICVFQPHQEKRLKALFKEFVSAFNDADNLILLDVFKVKGRDQDAEQRGTNADKRGKIISSEKLAEAIKKRKHSPAVLYLKNPKSLKKEIENILLCPKPYALNPIVIMMGAGDIYHHTKRLLTPSA